MINFENGKTPLSAEIFNKLQNDLLQLMFPIGSTYITQENVNPSEILGIGTWERFNGKVVLGLDETDTDLDTIGKTGGEKKHKLTKNEMPSHDHIQYVNANPGTGGSAIRGDVSNEGSGMSKYEQGATTGATGGGQAHNNMQPYEVVGYMWIRRH